MSGRKHSAKLLEDNQSAITLIKNGTLNRRSKHIDVRFHFSIEKYSEGLIKIDYVNSNDQHADIFTKPLGLNKFIQHRNFIYK